MRKAISQAFASSNSLENAIDSDVNTHALSTFLVAPVRIAKVHHGAANRERPKSGRRTYHARPLNAIDSERYVSVTHFFSQSHIIFALSTYADHIFSTVGHQPSHTDVHIVISKNMTIKIMTKDSL